MHTELLGGWDGTIRDAMLARGVTVTTAIVQNLHRAYVALLDSGSAAPVFTGGAIDAGGRATYLKLKDTTHQPGPTVFAFLYVLYTGAQSGKIPMAKYNPVEFARQQSIRERLDPSALTQFTTSAKNVGGFIGGKILLPVLLVAGALVALKFIPSRKGG
jgi:hypothetical protein